MFYNFKDQILKSIETGTEYLYRRYFFQKIPNIVTSVLFLEKYLYHYRRYFKSIDRVPSSDKSKVLT